MASTMHLMLICLDQTLPSLEKAHLHPDCITFGSSQGFFYLKEVRQSAQGRGWITVHEVCSLSGLGGAH